MTKSIFNRLVRAAVLHILIKLNNVLNEARQKLQRLCVLCVSSDSGEFFWARPILLLCVIGVSVHTQSEGNGFSTLVGVGSGFEREFSRAFTSLVLEAVPNGSY